MDKAGVFIAVISALKCRVNGCEICRPDIEIFITLCALLTQGCFQHTLGWKFLSFSITAASPLSPITKRPFL